MGIIEKDLDKIFSVYYEKFKFKKGSIIGEYFYYELFVGLINIVFEVEYIYDYELVMWLDVINCIINYLRINIFFISRWEVLIILLDIIGFRISEVYEIIWIMIKKVVDLLFISDK